MKIKLHSIAVLIIAFTFGSCGQNLARRYTNHWNVNTFDKSAEPQKFVQVDLNSAIIVQEKEKETKFNLLSLTDKGQEAFITSANSKSTNSKDLLTLLNTNFNFTPSEKLKVKIIPKTIKKTLIFTVDRLQYMAPSAISPGNPSGTIFNKMGERISYLELILKIPSANNAIFNSWDKYVTDKITLNLGKATAAQNWNASATISAKGSGEVSLTGSNSNEDFTSDKGTASILVNNGNNGANTNNYEILNTGKNTGSNSNSAKASGELGGSATVGYTDKYETSIDLSSEILKLSGSLAENKILLRQEGGPGIDLSGNIVVSVEYTLKDDWAPPIQLSKFSKLYDADGKIILLADIEKSFLMLIYPDIKKNVTGELDYSFLYRQVNGGNRHLPEAKQKVKYRFGGVLSKDNMLFIGRPIELIKTDDIKPKLYVIRQAGNNSNTQLENQDLLFETITEAASFLAYLRDLAAQSKPLNTITIGKSTINKSDILNLQIVTQQI